MLLVQVLGRLHLTLIFMTSFYFFSCLRWTSPPTGGRSKVKMMTRPSHQLDYHLSCQGAQAIKSVRARCLKAVLGLNVASRQLNNPSILASILSLFAANEVGSIAGLKFDRRHASLMICSIFSVRIRATDE